MTYTAADTFDNAADWLETHPHDYASLAGGPLAEALTRQELQDLANEDGAVPALIEHCRSMAARERALAGEGDG